MNSVVSQLSEQELAICCAALWDRSHPHSEDAAFVRVIDVEIAESIMEHQLQLQFDVDMTVLPQKLHSLTVLEKAALLDHAEQDARRRSRSG